MVKKYRVTVAGESYDVVVEEVGAETAPRPQPVENVPTAHTGDRVAGDGRVNSPLPGKVIAVKVAPGRQVKRGTCC